MSDGHYRGELAPEITEISEKKRTQLPLINTASRSGISLRSRCPLRLKYLVSKPGVFFTRMAVARPVSVCGEVMEEENKKIRSQVNKLISTFEG